MANKEKSWVREINNQIKDVNVSSEHNQWIKCSIYKVPDYIKDLNPKAYKPQVVSFGPFHYNEPQLKQMEMHKHRALLHYLKRAHKSFDEFVSSLEEIVQELQDTYQCLDEKWKSDKDKFLKLMIVDGCFMLEILRFCAGSLPHDYAYTDPIFSGHGMLYVLTYIKRDMLMIENQLPLLVLKKLISVESGDIPTDDRVNELVLTLWAPNDRTLPYGVGLGLHPLDLYRKSLLKGPPTPPIPFLGFSKGQIDVGKIRSAVELNEAGVKFKKSKTNNLWDISFHKGKGVLSLPEIVVDDATEYIYLNLMAFERLHVRAGNAITAFMLFMYMIDSAKDVAHLNRKGIIQNVVGSNEAVAELFKRLTKHITLDLDNLMILMLYNYIDSLDSQKSMYDIHKRVSDYCRKDWNMWRANLIHTYFKNPWSALSLAAALLVLVLALVQTIFTVLPYYHSDSPAAP